MQTGALGKRYRDGEIIVRQGQVGDCMYVVQNGQVEVLQEEDGKEVPLAVLGKGDFFGEMALFDHEVRSATVRAHGEALVLTVEKKTFLRRIHEDPSLALHIMLRMTTRMRELSGEVVKLKAALRAAQTPQ